MNLDSRPDRKVLFEERAKQAGIHNPLRCPSPCVTRSYEEVDALVGGVANTPTDDTRHLKISSSLSHYACIQDAKEHGYEQVLIFEDDAVFESNCESLMAPYVEELKTVKDWDLLYFGGSPDPTFHNIGVAYKETEHLWNCPVVWCIHAYAISHRFYDKILNTNPAHIYPMDMNYIHYPPTQRKYLITNRLLVTQDDDSVSDVWGRKMPRNDVFKKNYNIVFGTKYAEHGELL